MNSPFPGMDPYLERHWLDVHTKLVAYAADALNAHLPPDLIARTEERVAIESDFDQPPDQYVPDVRVLEWVETLQPQPTLAGAHGVALAPFRLTALVEPITERYIEVRDATGERLITVIGFASPTNKRGRGLEDFRGKRGKLLTGKVNFVEIDLVRTGDWKRLLRPHRPPKGVRSPYRTTVRTFNDPIAVEYYAISLREPMPAIKIPLRREDETVELALQPLVDQAYANGRYARTIDYTKPPEPPLDPEDAAWADELLRRLGKRQ